MERHAGMAFLDLVAKQVDPGAPGFWRDFLLGMLKPLAATAVVAMAVALSFSQRLGLEGEMLYAIARAFLQLSVIGFVLQFIFTQKNALWILLAYLFMVPLSAPFLHFRFVPIDESLIEWLQLKMPFLLHPTRRPWLTIELTNARTLSCLVSQVTVAGYTAGQRAKQVPRGKYIACVSILVGTAITMFLLVLLNVFPFTPRYIIPVAGMMVGNAMTVTGVTMKKLREDVKIQRNLVSHLSSSDLRWLLNCLYSPCRFLLGSARTRHESQKLLHQKQSTHSAHIFFSSCLSNSSKF
jgi:putative ABC transport system permease protein